MNIKDLTNFVTFLMKKENEGQEELDKCFDFLEFQDFDLVSAQNVWELAWFVSSYLKMPPDLTSLKNSLLFIYAKINWFRVTMKIEFEDYVNTCIVFAKNRAKATEGNYIIYSILREEVVIDIKTQEWYLASDINEEDVPDELKDFVKRNLK